MSLRISLIPLVCLLIFGSLSGQAPLHLQSGIFSGHTLSDTEVLPPGNVFLFQESTQTLPSDLRFIAYYPNGWKLVYAPNPIDSKSLINSGFTKYYYLDAGDKISPVDTEHNIWWIHTGGPADDELRSLESTGLSGIFNYRGLRNSLAQWASLPSVVWIEPAPGPAIPDNESAGAWLGNHSGLVGLAAFRTRGAGVAVQVNDDGMVGPHIDFRGRLNQSGATVSAVTEDHGDHIAGTIGGAGNRWPESEGMAPEARLRILDYSTDPTSSQGFFAVPQTYVNDGVRVVNTSYSDGCNSGYTGLARYLDEQTLAFPGLLHVFSAGNAGTANCGYGAGAGWGTITGGHKMAKNVLTVGNLYVPNQISANSSRGPAYDGRLKPDLVAPGSGVLSTSSLLGPNSYLIRSGTSMAAPMISGIAANLISYYRGIHLTSEPSGALIKAILLNTARDIGPVGPDYLSGYGLPNMHRSLVTIRNGNFSYGLLDQGNTWDTLIQVPAGLREVRFLLHWDDLAAGVGAGTALIQDLDLEVRPPGGNWVKPWILNSTPNAQALSALAFRGEDHLNTTEQVTLSFPTAGAYEIRVSASSMQTSFQMFAFTWAFLPPGLELGYPRGGDKLLAGDSIQVWWEAEPGSLPFSIDLSTDAGTTWLPLASNIPSPKREHTVFIPNQLFSRQCLMRISRGTQFSFSDSLFWIGPVPSGLKADSVCGSEVYLSWTGFSGASQYSIFSLGDKYMEPVSQTGSTQIQLFPVNTSKANWYAVSASYTDSFLGRRSRAILVDSGNFQCVTRRDLSISKTSFPVEGSLPQCVFGSTPSPSFWVYNSGTESISQFNAGFTLSGGAAHQQLVSMVLHPGDSALITLSSGISPTPGIHQMQYWVSFQGDQHPFNDSLRFSFEVMPSITESVPYLQSFDNFFLCSTSQTCESAWCTLQAGWRNAGNMTEDNTDWRVNWGATPTLGTGPTDGASNQPGLNRYLYVQAAGCSSKSSLLYSPCFQLPSQSSFLFFQYHMKGLEMGALELEMLEDGFWHSLWKTTGDQGDYWHTARISLGGFENRTVLFRFTARTGNGDLSDIAIDGFKLDTLDVSINPTNGLHFCKGDYIQLQANGNFGSFSGGIWQIRYNQNNFSFNEVGPHTIQLSETGIVSGNYASQSGGYPYFFQYNVIDKPQAQFSVTEIGNGGIEFTDNSLYSGQAEWFYGDGNSGSGAVVQHTYTQNGNWLVTLISQNICGTDTLQDLVSVSTVGVDNWQAQEEINVFPNPFISGFMITGLPQNKATKIELHDIQGRLVFSAETGEKTWETGVFIGGSGVYLLTIQSEYSTKRLRLIRIEP